MKTLILHPTDLSQWHALIFDAQQSAQVFLNEGTESYLVYLLMRFSQAPQFIESIVAMDFLQTMHQPRLMQTQHLKEIGDKSLLFCGLFPGIAVKRHVNLNYFAEMGQAAYLSVGEREEKQTADLYFQLSEQFVNLQQILQATRYELTPIDA